MATRAEIDAWVSARPVRKEFQLLGPQVVTGSLAANVKGSVAQMRDLYHRMAALRAGLKVPATAYEQHFPYAVQSRGDQALNPPTHLAWQTS